jgi:mono/diheme cytochrome c family protein
MEKKGVPYLFIWIVTSIAVVILLLKLVFPFVFMLLLGKPSLMITPSTLFLWFMIMTVLAGLLYASSSDVRLKEFLAFLHEGTESNVRNGLFIGLLVIFPGIIGYITYGNAAPSSTSPVELRIQHPTLPEEYEHLENPFRTGDEAEKLAMIEGRDLFQTYCRPCHGCAADGDGPFAPAFRLQPADFTDMGTIATVIEAFVFWRIKDGAFALPPAATPWDSVMPSWKDKLSDDQIWKVTMAAYENAGVAPRQPEKHAEH